MRRFSFHKSRQRRSYSNTRCKRLYRKRGYIEKTNKELKDENYYKKISHDPTREH